MQKNTISQKGSFIQSSNNVFKFILQESGNLQLLCHNKAIWSLDSSNVKYMVSQENGNLRLYQNDGKVVWETYSNEYHAETFDLNDNGNLVFYGKYGNPVSDSRRYRKIIFSGGKIMFLKLK